MANKIPWQRKGKRGGQREGMKSWCFQLIGSVLGNHEPAAVATISNTLLRVYFNDCKISARNEHDCVLVLGWKAGSCHFAQASCLPFLSSFFFATLFVSVFTYSSPIFCSSLIYQLSSSFVWCESKWGLKLCATFRRALGILVAVRLRWVNLDPAMLQTGRRCRWLAGPVA